MDDFLDILWEKIVTGVGYLAAGMDALVAPLTPLGPAWIIFILVLITVCITKIFSKYYNTKRYITLEKEFNYWYRLRKEALSLEDREKGKALGKNIDQAELNKVYYDYFFEGLLKKIITVYVPVLCMAAYVNEAFRPAQLMEKFGRDYVLRFPRSGEEPLVVGAVFWFVITLLATYVVWHVAANRLKKLHEK